MLSGFEGAQIALVAPRARVSGGSRDPPSYAFVDDPTILSKVQRGVRLMVSVRQSSLGVFGIFNEIYVHIIIEKTSNKEHFNMLTIKHATIEHDNN